MPTHTHHQVTPLFIDKVKVIVIDQRPALGSPNQQLVPPALVNLPKRCWTARYQNQEDPLKAGVFGAQLLSPEVFVLLAQLTVLQRKVVFGAEGFHPPRK